jgi:ATP-binding cassette, subfamily C, bacterial exporter for protease/lipase
MSPKKAQQQSLLKQTLIKLMPSLKQAVFFSFFVNLLILAPTWYMFEVYDRVVNSQSHSTLLMLTMMVIFLYVLLQFIELVRTKVMFQAAMQFDQALNDHIFKSIFQAKLRQIPGGNAQAFSDLKTIQDTISSSALMAIIDIPFALLSLIIIFAINTKMGWFAVAGALVISIIAAVNQYRIQPPLSEASRYSVLSQNYANGVIRNAQVVESMGMLRSVHKRWIKSHNKFLSMQGVASDLGGTNSALSKLVQTMQGSLLLGLGCWLSIQGDLSMDGSMMLVGSILGGRVIAPIITFLANWRVISNSKVAFNRLDQFLNAFSESNQTMKLPPPVGHLSVEGVVAAPPNSQTPILKGVTFKLPAGNSLAIVGPSASGKTTLARLITGIWPALSGKVRLDGADIYQWKKSELGPYVGYLPQDVELFDGSLAENIARFGDIDMEKVRAAANIVGLDGLISDLKDGYETQVGDEGSFLSGGQRQRVALARAIYGMPKFVVLDEPNSSLDEAGDMALLNALNYIKSQDTTLVVITHRMQVLSAIDYVMVLTEGQIKSFGPRDEVLNSLNQKNQPVATVTQDANGAE